MTNESTIRTPTTQTIEAAFEITDWQEQPYDEGTEGPALSTVTMTKRYHGEIEGSGIVQVLTARGDGGAGYLASERVTGTMAGREGSLVVQHGGIDDDGDLESFGRVVPGSGTGGFVGLSGRATEVTHGVLSLELVLPSDDA